MNWRELTRHVGGFLSSGTAASQRRLDPTRTYAILEPDPASVLRMSDATGILQHGVLTIPDRRHGYCVDDNARALMLMTQIKEMDGALREKWMTIYASFIQHAWNPDLGRFRNFMGYDRQWREDAGSEDSCGRTVWALGVTIRDAASTALHDWAKKLFDETAEAMATLEEPRAQAFVILGAGATLDRHPGHTASHAILARFGNRLLDLKSKSSEPDWVWFEASLAYDNARLSEALLIAGRHLGRPDLIAGGLETLDWIGGIQTTAEGYFRPVGSESFGRIHEPPLPYDQQPLEAQATIDAAIAAWLVDPRPKWPAMAETAYRWFLGQNDLDTPLATPSNNGCYDGLTSAGPNRNQGAESLLALQFASCAMKRFTLLRSLQQPGRKAAKSPVMTA